MARKESVSRQQLRLPRRSLTPCTTHSVHNSIAFRQHPRRLSSYVHRLTTKGQNTKQAPPTLNRNPQQKELQNGDTLKQIGAFNSIVFLQGKNERLCGYRREGFRSGLPAGSPIKRLCGHQSQDYGGRRTAFFERARSCSAA